MKTALTILQVNDYDIAGGAEVISINLFLTYLNRGYHSYLLVGKKRGSDPRIQEIEMGDSHNPWESLWLTKAGKFKQTKDHSRVSWMYYYCTKFFAHPLSTLKLLVGIQDYEYPATWNLLRMTPEKPDILHLHNLHENYFDLRALPYMSHQLPVVVTLHDTWLLGKFHKNFNKVDFSREKKMCDTSRIHLHIYLTRLFQLKDYRKIKKIFEQSQLYITAPSKWMMDQAHNSILKSSIADCIVIPNGVDLSIYHPYNKDKAREELGIPKNFKILVFVSNGIRRNSSKDFETLRSAISLVAKASGNNKIVFLAIGEDNQNEMIGNAEIRYFPFIKDPTRIARYYQAADLYIHASHMESWGLTITEALACGIPVVATNVGGIPEQITNEFNGYLTKPGDPIDMAEKINLLLNNDDIRKKMSNNALNDAKVRFDITLQAERYLAWYNYILKKSGNK